MFDRLIRQFLYRLKRPFHLVKTGLLRGIPAEMKYRFPARRLKILCITGTDGKTTSSTLLYQVLKQAGKKVALVSTVAAYVGDEEYDTGFHVTTPDPRQLQRFLAKMVQLECEYLVLESTSHGIYQYRLWGIHPEIVGITNITMEHLDYHVTHDNYVEAKAMLAAKAQKAVINADDEMSFLKLKKILSHSPVKVLTYSEQDELPSKISRAIKQRFPQQYNQMNSRLVTRIATELGIDEDSIATAIKNFVGIPGRMQPVGEEGGVKVIVDFAHTPNALQEVLLAIREQMKKEKRKGKLIAVFGCAGHRDWLKRPAMGRIGAETADLVIFTAEDPRFENVWSIIRQMKQNLEPYHSKVISIADRGEAVTAAITKYAKPDDVVGIFGKGHEKSMAFGRTEYPWNDTAAAQEALQQLHHLKSSPAAARKERTS